MNERNSERRGVLARRGLLVAACLAPFVVAAVIGAGLIRDPALRESTLKFWRGIENHFWIILTGSLAASACAIVGCFLVLRRLAMLGDAISHAVLPGIVIAFLVSNSRAPLPMVIGAGSLGLLTAFLTDTLTRRGLLQEDAAIGVTFTWLFAVGVILVSAFAGQVDLDAECVLYGEIGFVPWDRWVFSGADFGPRQVWILGAALLANLLFVTLGYKQLKICAFDPGLAASLGINVALWHYLLMGFVSVTTVASFESVGAILVVAMLVVPPNTAYLLTDRLSRMIIYSALIGCASSAGGYALAVWLDASIAGAISVVSGAFFILAAIFSPTHGVLRRHLESKNLKAEA